MVFPVSSMSIDNDLNVTAELLLSVLRQHLIIHVILFILGPAEYSFDVDIQTDVNVACPVVSIRVMMCCSINGNDTCTELLLENKGSVIVNLPDAKGRYSLPCCKLLSAAVSLQTATFLQSK